MTTRSEKKKKSARLVYAAACPKGTLDNDCGYRLVLHCSKQKTKTGSKAQPAASRV